MIECNRRECRKVAYAVASNERATCVHFAEFAPITLNQLAFGPINSIQNLYICRTSHATEVLQTLSEGRL